MVRMFNEHTVRRTSLLSGTWKMAADREDIGGKKIWYRKFPEDAKTVIVPSCWNFEEGLYDYEGCVWYSSEIVTHTPDFRLVFEAVMTEATVYFDGRKLGYHYGGFSAFDYVLTDVTPGIHTITVKVDNRFDDDSIPHKHVDWYHYGGIIRDVDLEELRGVCIMNQYVDYTLDKKLKNAKADFRFTLRNFEKTEKTDTLTVKLGGKKLFSREYTLAAGEEKELSVCGIDIKNIELWNPLKSKLYYVSYNTSTDDLIDRIGFRKIEAKGKDILINNKKVIFRGVNRHEDNADCGFAFPRSLMKRDIDILLDLNCNAVRGSHYPNSQSFVDYLDEYGLMFWSEIPIWGVGIPTEDLARPRLVERGLNMHREMVAQYRNHASVIMWGMHNEIFSGTPNAVEMTKLYYAELKKLDPSRLVIFASRMPRIDACYDFCDVVGMNLYHGWYGEDGMEVWPEKIEEMKRHKADTGNENKPLIMSEFGGAALYGCRSNECAYWSEDYQAKLLTYTLNLFHNDKDMSGTFIWQFCDTRTSKEAGLSRLRGFNNKGILNEYRKPKYAYFAVRDIYKQVKEKEGK